MTKRQCQRLSELSCDVWHEKIGGVGWQPLSERSERSGWFLSDHPLHSPRSFSGCHPTPMSLRGIVESLAPQRVRPGDTPEMQA